jgi:hypothetical protein
MLGGCSSSSNDAAPATGNTTGGTTVTYTGATTPAAVDASNAEDLATNAGEAVQQAADATSANVLGIEISGPGINLDALTVMLAESVFPGNRINLPSAFTLDGSCGGTATIPDSQLSSYTASSGPVTYTTTYTDYCQSLNNNSTYVINGIVSFTYADRANLDAGYTVVYDNVTAAFNGETTTVNMTYECSSLSNCTIISDYISSDGKTHRISGASNISGNATSGYNGTMTFYHATYGSVNVSATVVTYGGCGVFPNGGSITVTGVSGTATITFGSSCDYTIDWNDGSGSGTITGSFI